MGKLRVKRKIILASFVVILCGAVLLRAHDVYRIVGKITELSNTSLSLMEENGQTIGVKLRGGTQVWRAMKKVPRTELKVGLNVEVRGWGEDDRDLEAMDITIVPPPKPSK
jgi:hypothetical protein